MLEALGVGSRSVSLNQPVVFFMGADPHPSEIITFLHSERPIKVVWRLRHPLPAEMFEMNRRGDRRRLSRGSGR
jgi:hypothetical protein